MDSRGISSISIRIPKIVLVPFIVIWRESYN